MPYESDVKWRKVGYTGSGVLAGGAVAGLIAGAVMGLAWTGLSAYVGESGWMPIRTVAAIAFGVEALVLGPAVYVAGWVIHLATAAVLGIIFAAITRAVQGTAAALFWGVLYGAAVWAVMTFGIQPFVNPVLADRMSLMGGAWFAVNLIYGAMLSTTPTLRRSFSNRYERISDLPLRDAA